MSMQSKFSDVFAEATEMDENKKGKYASELRNLESGLDKAANDIRNHLRTSEFGMSLEPSQIKEIIEKSLNNLKSGI
jgi:hypothetical protein